MDPSAFREEAQPEPQQEPVQQPPVVPRPPPEPQVSFPASPLLNRGRMPLIPEEPEEMTTAYSRWPRSIGRPPARTQRVSPLTMYNFNNTDLFNDNHHGRRTTNTHKSHNTNRDDDFKDYECCPECYGSQLVALCRFHNLPTEEIDVSVPKKEPVAQEESVRPFESYVNETDIVIKKLLAEMDEREKVNSN